MKKFLILLFILTSLSLAAQDAPDCLKFHTGKFKVEGDDETIITRTKKYQIEKNKDTNVKDKVVWIDECKYKLVPLKIKKDKKKPP